MKHILIAVATIVIGLSGQAFARLGQTEEQVSALFGKPIDADKPDKEGVTTNTYKNPSGEYIALVQFLKGHSIAEAYSRVDGGKLSEKEMSIFSPGKFWRQGMDKRSKQARMGKKRPSRKGVVRNALGTTDLAYPGEVGAPRDLIFRVCHRSGHQYANIR